METFLKNAFLNAPSYWDVADSAQIEEHCLIVIESSEISRRSKCTLRESQIQSHKAGRGLKVEYRLYDRDMVLQNGLRPQLRGSRERNAIPDSGPRNQRAKGSRRERPRNRKKRQRETRFLRAQCCHREHSTVSGLMSYSLICAHSLKHFSCIPQLTDFFAFFTQWPPAQR